MPCLTWHRFATLLTGPLNEAQYPPLFITLPFATNGMHSLKHGHSGTHQADNHHQKNLKHITHEILH
jgi:hypothetical protein